VREIAIEDVEGAVAAGATLVDVREPREYVAGHLPGALLVPMAQVTGRLAEIDRERPVLVVCATGNRSGVICNLLRAAGYDALNVVGGTSAWVRSGRPVETGLAPAPEVSR
jgi:rhodanese-related sulfurtransferase